MSSSRRLQKVTSLLDTYEGDFLLIEKPIDLFYFTGLQLSVGQLLIHQSGEAHLFVDGRYIEAAQKNSPCPCSIYSERSFIDYLKKWDKQERQKIVFDSLSVSYKVYTDWLQLIGQAASEEGEKIAVLMGVENPLKHIRSFKEPIEMEALRRAAELGSRGFDFACSLLKEGISEEEVAIELEIFYRRQGGQKLAFEPIIAFGSNSAMPHYRAGTTRLKAVDIALIDIGVVVDHYHSDMTRVVFLGKPNETLLQIYHIVQKAQKAALDLCRPGVFLGDLDRAARSVIEAEGYGSHFKHSLGHGIGLEIHEYPLIKGDLPWKDIPLASGMAVTIEPGIYVSDLGGIRIEDSIIITPNGYENLTKRSTEPLCQGRGAFANS